jgi:hypothetical protein
LRRRLAREPRRAEPMRSKSMTWPPTNAPDTASLAKAWKRPPAIGPEEAVERRSVNVSKLH